VWVLSAGRFVSSASSFLMLFLMLYLTGDRSLGIGAAGLVAGVHGVGSLAGNFTGGRWGDRLGHRRVMLAASTAVGLGTAALPWTPTHLLPVTLPLIGYLGATSSVSQGALAALAVPVGNRRSSVAVSRAASNAGFVLGPPLAALLAAHSGYDALFVVDGLSTVVLRVLTARMLPPDAVRPAPVSTEGIAAQGLWRSLAANRSLLVLLVGVVLVDLVYRQLYSTLPVYLRDHGQPLRLYTLLIAVGSGLILLLEVPVALWLRRRPAVSVIASGYALVALGFGLFGVHLPGVGVAAVSVVAMVVLTAGEILYKTTATAHVLDEAPDHLVGQYQGLYTGAATSGMLLSAPVGGLVYATWPSALWPLCAVVAGTGALLALASRRPHVPVGAATVARSGTAQ
jgi:MFS family permease